MARTEDVLETRRLLVGYGGAPVCGEVSFRLMAGEVLAVVGFNGAGKSTVVRTLAGRQERLDGEVHVLGLPVVPDSVLFRRQVAVVFDEDVFFPSLTVREHLLLVARGHAVRSPEDAVDAELDYFGLAQRADGVPDSLSSGQRRRLLLAAAFIRPSSLLILDEPEQRLDPVMRDRLADRVRQRAATGTAVVLVTHSPHLLIRTSSACLVIDDVVERTSAERGAQIIAGS